MQNVDLPLIFAQAWAKFLSILVAMWHKLYDIPTNELCTSTYARQRWHIGHTNQVGHMQPHLAPGGEDQYAVLRTYTVVLCDL